jgi:hypothetical protein
MTNNLKDTLWMLAAGIRAAVVYGVFSVQISWHSAR